MGLSARQKKTTGSNILKEQEQNRIKPRIMESMKTRHVRIWREYFLMLKLSPAFTILVVDDMPDQVKTVTMLLSQFENVVCESAFGGEEAVKMVKSKMNVEEMYHLVITDLTMPYDGYEATKDIRNEEKARKSRPGYCVIGVTGEGISPGSDLKAMKSGMDDTIPKPLKIPLLKLIIEKRVKELGIDFEVKLVD